MNRVDLGAHFLTQQAKEGHDIRLPSRPDIQRTYVGGIQRGNIGREWEKDATRWLCCVSCSPGRRMRLMVRMRSPNQWVADAGSSEETVWT